MSKVTCDMAMSVDGFVAGSRQSADQPFGEGADGRLHRWMFDLEQLDVSGSDLVTHLRDRVIR